MAHHAVDERHALAATLRRTAPESETLCGEWDAAQLTAHLVLRERSIVEIGGRAPVDALRRRAQRQLDEVVGSWGYERLVDTFERGPSWREVIGPVPVAWFWSIPPVRERVDLLEYVIHHEDVRRAAADWEPRRLSVATQMAVWRSLRLVAPFAFRSLPYGVVLRWPSHGDTTSRKVARGGDVVTVTADPVELALLTFGRQRAARMAYDGPDDTVEALQTATLAF